MRKTHRGSPIETLLAAGLFTYVVVVCSMAVFGPPSSWPNEPAVRNTAGTPLRTKEY